MAGIGNEFQHRGHEFRGNLGMRSAGFKVNIAFISDHTKTRKESIPVGKAEISGDMAVFYAVIIVDMECFQAAAEGFHRVLGIKT